MKNLIKVVTVVGVLAVIGFTSIQKQKTEVTIVVVDKEDVINKIIEDKTGIKNISFTYKTCFLDPLMADVTELCVARQLEGHDAETIVYALKSYRTLTEE